MRYATLVACFCVLATNVLAEDSRTVIGPSNIALRDGAQELQTGDPKEGVRLTLIGLSQATDGRERRTARSNLCAGYALLGDYATALSYCNEVLQDDDSYWRAYSNRALIYIKLRRFDEALEDILKGEAISPQAKTLQAVRKMYLDATDPVAPSVIIDDRQDAEGEDFDVD